MHLRVKKEQKEREKKLQQQNNFFFFFNTKALYIWSAFFIPMIQIFKSLFNSKPKVLDMQKYLLVGLGNIGPKYEETRHNIGFKVVEALAKEEGASFETDKLGDICKIKIKGRSAILLKPNTFMNLSGKAIKYWLEKENIAIENLLIITDDIHIDFGTFRIKAKGSAGGHNGLKDTEAKLNTGAYPRFRFGVGSQFNKGRQVDFVLGEWSAEEKNDLDFRLQDATAALKSFVFAGLSQTMNAFNGKMEK